MLDSPLLLLVAYVVVATLLTGLMDRTVRKVYQGIDASKLAFEAASLVMFVLWLPFGLGLVTSPTLFLFLLPTFREVFDFVWIFGVDRQGFSPTYQRFITSHHLNSIAGRTALVGGAWWLFNTPQLHQYCLLVLQYYCCSIFLVLPETTEKLFLKGRSAATLAAARTFYFVSARLTHFVVYVLGSVLIWTSLEPLRASLIFLLVTAAMAFNEYLSITSGWPALRDSLARAREARALSSFGGSEDLAA